MANTTVPIVALTANSANLEGAGTAIVAGNTHVVDCSGVKSGKLLIRIQNTFAGSKAATVKAGGVHPPAFRKSLGDLVVTLAAQNDIHTLVLESARFVGQAAGDQKVNITVAASMTGTIWAYQLPDTV